jgi:cell wall assembly regulator SMI1
MNSSVLQGVREKWTNCKAPKIQLGCNATQIAAFEARWGCELSADVRTSYEEFNGFDQWHGYQDEQGFNLWPLEKIEPLQVFAGGQFSVPDSPDMFVFADYLDFSWGYAFALEEARDHTRVFMVGTADSTHQRIADSMTEFLDLVIRDDSRLYPK